MAAVSVPKDVVPVTVLTAVGVFFSAGGGDGGAETWIGALVVPTLTLPVLWRQRAPLACTVAVSAGMVLSGIPTFDQTRCAIAIPVALLVLFSLSAARSRRQSLLGLLVAFGGLAFVGETDPVLEGGVPGFLLVAGVLLVVAWAGGQATGSRQRLIDELAVRSSRLKRRREQVAALAVEVERTRLVGDLDRAAHARVRQMAELSSTDDRDPDRLRETFADIERAAREALNEMRALVGVLGSGEPPSLQAQPTTLTQLDDLLAQAREGGRVVALEIDGEARELPDGVEVATYRLVQHGLAAVAAATKVSLRYATGGIELEVAGTEAPGGAADEALAAVRERVTTCGGSLSVDAPQPGRRLLRAWLPTAAAHG